MIRILALLSVSLAGPALAAGPLAPPGAPADAFPKPDRPVAEIVAPRWSSESERDRAGEFAEVAKGMGIAAGETVAVPLAVDTDAPAPACQIAGEPFCESLKPAMCSWNPARS